jgi:hypothetical protein
MEVFWPEERTVLFTCPFSVKGWILGMHFFLTKEVHWAMDAAGKAIMHAAKTAFRRPAFVGEVKAGEIVKCFINSVIRLLDDFVS